MKTLHLSKAVPSAQVRQFKDRPGQPLRCAATARERLVNVNGARLAFDRLGGIAGTPDDVGCFRSGDVGSSPWRYRALYAICFIIVYVLSC